MMEGAQLSSKLRDKFWSETATTATYVDNFYPVEGSQHGSASNFFGKGYESIINSPKIFGEACIVADCNKIKAKLAQ